MTLVDTAGKDALDSPRDPDLAAVKRVLGGDSAAFGEVVRRHQDGLLRLLTGIITDHHAAEDVLQEVLLTAYLRLPTFRFEASFKTWLYRIAVRQGSGARRRLRAWWGSLKPLPAVESVPAGDPARQLENLDLALACLRRLKGPERTAFVLFAEGWSYDQIAATMDCPIGSVGTWISRARQRLDRSLPAPRAAPETEQGTLP